MSQYLHLYLQQAIQLHLLDVYLRTLKQVTQRDEIRGVCVGTDQIFFNLLEALTDHRLRVLKFLEGNPNDIFHPAAPWEDLKGLDFDTYIICAETLEQEALHYNRAIMRHYTHSDLEVPMLRLSKLYHGFYSTLGQMIPGQFITYLNQIKLSVIAWALTASISRAEGCIAECGSYLGGTAIFMATLMKQWGARPRPLHAFDTYEGMPAPVEQDGETVYQAGLFNETSLEMVSHFVRSHGLSSNITLHKGLVQDTLPQAFTPDQKIAFALVDTDQYAGTIAGLLQFLPRLSPNGLIVVDDYGVQGVQIAVAEAKAAFPKMQGFVITENFYLLWNEIDHQFLSH